MAPRHVRSTLFGVCLAFAAAAPALAQGQSKPVAQYGDWSVYVSTSSPKVCYAISQPKKRAPSGLNRDPAYFFISTRPGEKVKNEVSVTVGFPIKSGSEATVKVGSLSLGLYTKDNGAWVRNVTDEGRLVDAMRKGSDLTFASTSGRGNVTTDTYSLKGVSAALDRVAKECN
ncbi:invasion associated locus B family protein [Xanthobacter sp. TB0139]|uniref:invasion associated locus B family protein n=1 Tax=Xanthobacter sp. TB0139 TaxID=3459178 RepID=UPI0040398C36